jgi:hypothetical protein
LALVGFHQVVAFGGELELEELGWVELLGSLEERVEGEGEA